MWLGWPGAERVSMVVLVGGRKGRKGGEIVQVRVRLPGGVWVVEEAQAAAGGVDDGGYRGERGAQLHVWNGEGMEWTLRLMRARSERRTRTDGPRRRMLALAGKWAPTGG